MCYSSSSEQGGGGGWLSVLQLYSSGMYLEGGKRGGVLHSVVMELVPPHQNNHHLV